MHDDSTWSAEAVSRDLADYYRRRAREYDDVFAQPVLRADLGALGLRLRALLAGKAVLEVAAGTGYWTAVYADDARSVLATDINREVLDIATARRAWPASVEFRLADAFDLGQLPGSFEAAFVGFFWSHVPLGDIDRFLAAVTGPLEPGALVIIVDNNYVEGRNHPVTDRDAQGNTYQRRRLADGSEWKLLKNFPTPDDLVRELSRVGSGVEIESWGHYWLAQFRVA
jgi:ubiquinone/menaquinone biosynthesis C-methylase UbiE